MLMLAGCRKEDVLIRDVDAFSVDCNAQSVTHYVLASGDWALETDADWIDFDPANGTGDGELYQPYTVKIAYNKGDAREAVYYLIHNDIKSMVTVSQAACDFKFTSVSFCGNLAVGTESTAWVEVAYSGAAGNEKLVYTAELSGEGASGLAIEAGEAEITTAGKGVIVIPVGGTPVAEGEVTVSVVIDGKPLEPVKTVVAGAVPVPVLTGLPCGWNFYALGLDGKGAIASEYATLWQPGAVKDGDYVTCTSGDNPNAKLTAVVAAGLADHTFNPSIQAKGLLEGDYWLITIPVQNLEPSHRLKIEMGCGSAGSSVGFYILEYSTNGTAWSEVPGAVNNTRGEDTFRAHLWNTGSSIGASGFTNTRKSYDKATDDTYRVYSLDGVSQPSGNLYFRLRALKYRATPNSTMEVASGWTDLKGFEVTVISE